MITLRSDQRTTVDKAKPILQLLRIVYIAAQMRTGKSIMGITTAFECGFKRLLVVTKKIAVDNIKQDVKDCAYPISIKVINFDYRTLAKLNPDDYDCVIVDEANEAAGVYPQPSKRAEAIKKIVGFKPLILMSGTPTPESWSQIYYQFDLSAYSPFKQYKIFKKNAFYKWAKVYVEQDEVEVDKEDGTKAMVKQWKKRHIGGHESNDYSKAKEELIKPVIAPYMVYLTQVDAGFKSLVEEEILYVPIDARIYKLMKLLKKDKVYQMKCGDTIIADTPVRMQNIFHQLSSGTIKVDYFDEDGKKKSRRHILDESKAWKIKSYFAGYKIAIFYKFIAEFELLKKVFPNWTDNDQEFNKHEHLTWLKQIVSGRSGTDLQTADYLIMYNIDFSATSYWQGRERMGNWTRTKLNKMFWVFSEHGFEKKVYQAVVKKMNYTNAHFKKDLKLWDEPNLTIFNGR